MADVDGVKDAARLSVAPMMDWTDRHCRAFHRQMTRHTLLYTEMVTSAALVRGGARRLLAFGETQHPVALQLGGSDPSELAEAAKMGADEGYDEINLNVGCPSDRVQSGAFGAVLMRTPELVAECVSAMMDAQPLPVTVKCRIGVDDQTVEDTLPQFIEMMSVVGVTRMTIHARKAWLKGLSPKENREVPPLDYDLVARMKGAFPGMNLSLNGGITTLDAAMKHLNVFDGVMIGRAAYHTPWEILGQADSQIFGASDPVARPEDAVIAMEPYIEDELRQGTPLHAITRHMLGVFTGRPGARHWRRVLSEGARAPDAGFALVRQAMQEVTERSDLEHAT